LLARAIARYGPRLSDRMSIYQDLGKVMRGFEVIGLEFSMLKERICELGHYCLRGLLRSFIEDGVLLSRVIGDDSLVAVESLEKTDCAGVSSLLRVGRVLVDTRWLVQVQLGKDS
jgi:hypothetical protein